MLTDIRMTEIELETAKLKLFNHRFDCPECNTSFISKEDDIVCPGLISCNDDISKLEFKLLNK